MICSLVAYDADGRVVGTLDHVVHTDAAGAVIGLVDFEAHELAGGKHRDIWTHGGAVGSGTWPEWLGTAAHDFSVELTGQRISALVHNNSGHRRERFEVEARIAATPIVEGARDIRHITGGPNKHLTLDEHGRTIHRRNAGSPSHLPRIGR